MWRDQKNRPGSQLVEADSQPGLMQKSRFLMKTPQNESAMSQEVGREGERGTGTEKRRQGKERESGKERRKEEGREGWREGGRDKGQREGRRAGFQEGLEEGTSDNYFRGHCTYPSLRRNLVEPSFSRDR